MVTPRSSKQLAEESGGEISGVFHGQGFPEAGVILRDVAPKGELIRSGFAINRHGTRAGPLRRGHHPVIDFVVLGKWRDGKERALAGPVGGHDVHKDDVVVDRECRNRCAPLSRQIVLRPAFAVALKDEVGIVGYDVAVNVLQPLLDKLVRETLQDLDRRRLTFRVHVVGKRSSREVGIATSDQHQIGVEPSVLVERARGFHGGLEAIIRPDQSKDGRSRE